MYSASELQLHIGFKIMTEFIFFQYLHIPILGSQECDYYENPKFLSTQFVKIIHSV